MAKTLNLDFTNVEAFNRLPEGYHNVKIVKVDEARSQSGNDMLKITFESLKQGEGRVIETYPLIDTALWRLKSLLIAIGMKADGRIRLDLDKLIGKKLEVNITHDNYNGQTRARVSETNKLVVKEAKADEDDAFEFPDDFEEEGEKPAPKKAAKKKPEPEEREPESDDVKDFTESDQDDDFEDWPDDDDDFADFEG